MSRNENNTPIIDSVTHYNKYNVPLSVKKYIKYKEKELDKQCHRIWADKNQLGEIFLYAQFRDNWEETLVTLAYFTNNQWKVMR